MDSEVIVAGFIGAVAGIAAAFLGHFVLAVFIAFGVFFLILSAEDS